MSPADNSPTSVPGRASRPDSLPHLDILGHDVYEHGAPHRGLRRVPLHRTCGVDQRTAANGHDGHGFWSLTAHRDVVAVHKDWRTFSSGCGGTEIGLEHEARRHSRHGERCWRLTLHPATKLRQLVNPAFSRMAVETYAQHATSLMAEVLDGAMAAAHHWFGRQGACSRPRATDPDDHRPARCTRRTPRSSFTGPTRSCTTPTPTTPPLSATAPTPTRTACCRSAAPCR